MHKIARTGAVLATGLLTALALTGCGSDGDKGDSGKDSGADASPTAGASSEAPSGADGGSGDGSAGDAKALEGAWAGKTDGKAVVLSVAAGKAVVVAESHVCTGTVTDMGKLMLDLKCADGDTARTMGAVESNDGETVVISWDAGAKDTLAKTDADSLKGIADLPGLSDLPDLPDLPTP
ncbi:hypothetical protein FKN01_00255 [Streptomyces sp. 130]|uniref:hypothetical protein n=1 Tax=Streptomyces sp. 130 TaxID=2591006 RepID=UPI001180E7FE|nr:hypothetical protein [Streptomyces sp. 130]TRV81783.1 hypothetical protein FKN01_00255 [Streptomyces sp. 130]